MLSCIEIYVYAQNLYIINVCIKTKTSQGIVTTMDISKIKVPTRIL